jgi:hypothetical protein
MTTLLLDLQAHFGCQGNVTTHEPPSVSISSGEIRDIRALGRCPGSIVFREAFFLLIFHKQPERKLLGYDVLQCDIYLMLEISGMNINRSEASHDLGRDLG